MAGAALSATAQAAKQAFRLEWEGHKVPRGAIVGGHIISWTQNGQVIAGGEMVGTYERTIEFGGEGGNRQEMLIYLF